jgi:hypothetical protein
VEKYFYSVSIARAGGKKGNGRKVEKRFLFLSLMPKTVFFSLLSFISFQLLNKNLYQKKKTIRRGGEEAEEWKNVLKTILVPPEE